MLSSASLISEHTMTEREKDELVSEHHTSQSAQCAHYDREKKMTQYFVAQTLSDEDYY